jgi:hypothetical protein
MLIDWTKHIKDPEDKSKLEDAIRGSRQALDRLLKIIEDQEAALDRNEMSISVYDTPNWAERQAHKNGNREAFAYLKTLIRSTHDR